ncbi:MAG: glycerol-3-phosphate acyltransferase [Bacillota bacterium]
MKEWFLAALLGYLLGSFPSAVVVGRVWAGLDLRKAGSGNPGTANTLRVLGILPAAIVFVADFAKGLAAVVLARAWFGPAGGWLGGLTAVLGHVYPVFAGLRGGKGLATGFGAISFLDPFSLAIFVPVWACFYLWRRRVALASAAAVAAVGLAAVFRLSPWPAVVIVLGTGLIFARHWPEARSALFSSFPVRPRPPGA